MNQICKSHFKFMFLIRIFCKLDFARFKTWIRILYDAFMNLYAFFFQIFQCTPIVRFKYSNKIFTFKVNRVNFCFKR